MLEISSIAGDVFISVSRCERKGLPEIINRTCRIIEEIKTIHNIFLNYDIMELLTLCRAYGEKKKMLRGSVKSKENE